MDYHIKDLFGSINMETKKKIPPKKKEISEEDINRIRNRFPDYISDSSDEVQDLYIIAELAKEERDLSPKRYFDLVLNEGTEEEKTISIDFQQTVNVGAVVKTYGGDIAAVRSANAKRLQYLHLDRAYQRAVLELNKAMGVRSRKPRNIVDYTGTIMELLGSSIPLPMSARLWRRNTRLRFLRKN